MLGFEFFLCTAKKKPEIKTLLDGNRSRNIEIFLPRLPLPLENLESTLSEQLNNVNDSLELESEHIVALKRYASLLLCMALHLYLHTRYQPTEEDKEMYKRYTGDKTLLQQADVFLMKVQTLFL